MKELFPSPGSFREVITSYYHRQADVYVGSQSGAQFSIRKPPSKAFRPERFI